MYRKTIIIINTYREALILRTAYGRASAPSRFGREEFVLASAAPKECPVRTSDTVVGHYTARSPHVSTVINDRLTSKIEP